MLAFDFDYYLPDTIREATDIYASLTAKGGKPYYYSGGTEIISMARVFSLQPDAVIDIKNIPECQIMGTDGARLVFGSAVTLSEITESGLFPLLGLAGGRIADHTIQVKITLGGNLAGTIYYHETLPPLLICDSFITIAATDGSLREVPICDILAADKGLRPGELIIKVSLEQDFARLPHSHVKKVQSEKIGYPLVSVSSICYQDQVRLAVSGLCSYPVRLKDISLQNNGSITELAAESLFDIKQPRIDDVSGSAAYREFILIKTVEKIIHSYMN